ncbi:tight adherence protein C [Bisgaardia hudsonensis]|uniref:Tight adherence protein C n=2 Tax=Bisgaardia hudsonensis TaxID=109472 RepID=A0A4V2SJ15_9PAST|nr:tight adherence protein C [Bisgaardia hudsonensis]
MLNTLLFYFFLILAGIVILTLAISNKNKYQRNKEILLGIRPKEKSDDEVKKGKNRQQVELELLLINNNKILKAMAIIDKNIKIKLLIMSVCFTIYYLLNRHKELVELLMGISMIFVVVVLIPGIVTNIVLKRKIRLIMSDLPGFIDLVAVCVQTGMTIDMALKRVAIDFKKLNADLSYVILRIIRKSEITSLNAALDDLSVSLPTKEIRMFSTVMQQSINFGSSIYYQLIQLSADIRELQLLTIEEHLGTLSAKMSIPLILFIMFPIIILILAPGAMRVLPNVF